MAGKEEKPKSAEARRAAGGSRRFLKYCLVLLVFGSAALAWLSMLTFHATDWPAAAVYPPPATRNAAGCVGAYVAYMLRYWLGTGVYMGLLFATVTAGMAMIGSKVGDLPWRLIGVVLLITSTSAAVFLAGPLPVAAAGDGMGSPAGILGIAAGNFLLAKFGSIGGWLVDAVAFCVGLMLTADNLVLRLPRLGRKIWEHRGGLSTTLAVFRPRVEPAVAGTGGTRISAVAGSAAPRTEAPSRPASPPRTPPPDRSAAPTRPARPQSPDRPAPVSDRPAPPVAPPAAAKPAPAKTPARPPDKEAPPAPDGAYVLPSTDLLADPTTGYEELREAAAEQKRAVLQQTLADFNVDAQVLGYQTGPVITLFELALAPGVKVSQVDTLSKDIARSLAVPGVRIVSPIAGKDTIGIEVPNLDKEIVRIKELMAMAPQADRDLDLPLYLGKDAGGNAIVADLASMPHLLIAGTTGSGKSVCINSVIVAMLMTRTPEQVRLILVDPKMVEMAAFENVPHLLCPIINDFRKAEDVLEWAAGKMDERYELFKEARVKNIRQYNELGAEVIYDRLGVDNDEDRTQVSTRLPYYVIIVDELADLIMTSNKEVENHIIRIAQKARAVGIHMILATQRPSVNVVTGLIKSNMPCRISFRVASRQESRIVLDQNGADVLLGQGDMLFLQPGSSQLIRAQGTFVDDSEIRSVVESLRKAGRPQFNAELIRISAHATGDGGSEERDELFDQAAEIVLATQRGSVSLLQRRLQIGYSRASRIIDQMADAGFLGDYKGSQARECLMTLADWQALQASIHADQSGESSADGEPTSV